MTQHTFGLQDWSGRLILVPYTLFWLLNLSFHVFLVELVSLFMWYVVHVCIDLLQFRMLNVRSIDIYLSVICLHSIFRELRWIILLFVFEKEHKILLKCINISKSHNWTGLCNMFSFLFYFWNFMLKILFLIFIKVVFYFWNF